MSKHTKLISVFAGLLLFPGTQLYALDGTKKGANLISSETTAASFETISAAKMQKMYLISDAKIQKTMDSVSDVLETQLSGTQVSIISVDGDMCQVLTQSGKVGYINIDLLTSQKEYVFIQEDVVMYASASVDLKAIPSDKAEAVETVDLNTELHLTGSNELKYWRVVKDGTTYYVDHDLLNTKKTYVSTAVSYTINWNGAALNPSSGSIMGPSGKETYYNLNMSGVVNVMRNMGNTDEYYVRADGVKMLGNYVMVAANLQLRPRGSLVMTSLGMGIVCDTGGFAINNPTQLDIAVAW